MPQRHAPRLQSIDALRGLAAFTVMLSHYIPFWNSKFESIPVLVPGVLGYYAVHLFFVISGFVIFATVSRCATTSHFLFLRFSRLYPAYWGSIVVATLLLYFGFDREIWLGGIVVNLTMFHEFIGYPNIDEVYWSLTVELAFYLHVAWLMKVGWIRNVATICMLWLGIACAWHVVVAPQDLFPRSLFAMIFAPDYAHFFVLGIALYGIWKRGPDKTGISLIVASIFTSFVVSGIEGLAVTTFISALVGVALFADLKILTTAPLLWLGNISFSLYLIHRNIGYALLLKLGQLDMGPATSIILVVLFSLIIATLLTYGIEKPSLRLLRSRVRTSRSP